MGWKASDIPDQSGRIAIVTGANSGLGLETSRELARNGAHVVMAVRSMEKGMAALSDIEREIPAASLELRQLDLASLDSIRAFASDVLFAHPAVDVLVNNAGIMAVPEGRTTDGFETQLGVNHLGHFALTALLLPALARSRSARVVTVTSTARRRSRGVDPDNPHLRGRYDAWLAYGQSKLANVQFAVELERRLRAADLPIESLAADPGFSNTELQATSVTQARGGLGQRFFDVAVGFLGSSPAHGALSQLRAATDPMASGGELYAPRWVLFGSPVRRGLTAGEMNPTALATLWRLSENETGVRFEFDRGAGGLAA